VAQDENQQPSILPEYGEKLQGDEDSSVELLAALLSAGFDVERSAIEWLIDAD
jgi:hypothetical protein